jgi:phosphoadenosine phosphosulfate reductase
MQLKEITNHSLSLLKSYVESFKKEGKAIYATSSFQTQSVPLLHLLGTNFSDIQILFIDTGFLFPETYEYKDLLVKKLNLKVKTIKTSISKHQQIDTDTGFFQYSLNPDRCCEINKVEPLERFLSTDDVWISGVRRDQSSIRKELKTIELNHKGVLKFHPMLEWNSKNIYDYIKAYNLPKHPLEQSGYVSIGCVPCTHKWSSNGQRGGRWLGSKKIECGLHLKK